MTPWLAVIVVLAGSLAAQGSATRVYPGKDGRLQYSADARGNRVMDFSHAGFKGGGVALPNVHVARRLQPAGGDDTPQIQAAIDEISRLPRDAAGYRGAVQLGAGTYNVSGVLKIAASGVVLRGVGSGDGGTTISVTGPAHRVLVEIVGTGSWLPDGPRAAIIDAYVPGGADSVEVESAAGFKAGDAVLIERPDTVHAADRTIRNVSGRRITLDVPLSDSYDAVHLTPARASIVRYKFTGRIQQVGFESMRVTVPRGNVPGVPVGEPQYSLLRLAAVSDAWVRDIVVEDTANTITIGHSARRVTLENVHVRHGPPVTGVSAPADFAISGTQVLLHRSTVTGNGVWPIVTEAGVTGPNVVLHFKADGPGVGLHQAWPAGLLVEPGVMVTPTSLYVAQLQDRLGPAAVRNIGYIPR